ncbi:MAG: glycogen/starch/alpha-glucan phosphorylase [Ruminococcaceae bacterium]|nr:glycogen/starch/alpha-glucan phosphorylase [Oscillospiraceae bacterium]
MSLEKDIRTLLRIDAGKRVDNATPTELYHAVSKAALAAVDDRWSRPKKGKRVAYLSAEFLIGRMIYQNLYNMQATDTVAALLSRHKVDMRVFEEIEDAALGNGGLGRLAACFLESAATRDIPLDGYGIRYRYGLFKQSFEDGFQHEEADNWLRFGDPWSRRREDERVCVRFGENEAVWAVPYDMPVIGYGVRTVNTLRLWQAEALTPFDFAAFNAQRYEDAVRDTMQAERISAVLYPNDDTDEGKALRLKQQYFFASASIQDMLRRYRKKHGTRYDRFADCYAVQLNDTHPVVAIPEFIRLLCEDGVSFTKALNLARRVFAYTNHTVLPEALEKWGLDLFSRVLPHLMPYVKQLHHALQRELRRHRIVGDDAAKYWIIEGNTLHMARMAVFASHSVNGVAELHTELLKTQVLPHWYALYPERFNNKTNGITQRRWLGLANPELSALITSRIGAGWICDLTQLRQLESLQNDSRFLADFAAVKAEKKRQLAAFLEARCGVKVDPSWIFDIQAKRLHEYKRQLLNAFSIADTYFGLKDGRIHDFAPTVYIFAAKAAPGYFRAKAIIKYINEWARIIAADPDVNDKMQVVFLPDYNVSAAEFIMPAADVSEQISTAGTEASGTGNMKFMLNGAVTLGTYDGANIEIVEQAGRENNYIFGLTADEVATLKPQYDPNATADAEPRLRRVLQTLVDGTVDDGGTGMFRELYDAITVGASWHQPDHYLLMADMLSYCDAKMRTNRDWCDREAFTKKCLLNTARAGKFSSDRSVEEYAADIWGV